MLVHMAKDIRVLLVKLCDRLDNMRTLDHMKPEAQERIARETMEIYAPLANRLGIAWMKSELEDLAFRYLEPDAYKSSSARVRPREAERDDYISRRLQADRRRSSPSRASTPTWAAARSTSIPSGARCSRSSATSSRSTTSSRSASSSSRWPTATRALGVVHGMWTPVPGRFKDYVALPKPNMYQSLHTTVIGPRSSERMEVQIRTADMHRVAEQGIAAHWKYKERAAPAASTPRTRSASAGCASSWSSRRSSRTPQEFLESVKVDLFQDEVYVFTPKGDVRVFPRGPRPSTSRTPSTARSATTAPARG
jgi:guanosine-3',5'-bis(diphosphate) 3'-pyrophosphohydrolase